MREQEAKRSKPNIVPTVLIPGTYDRSDLQDHRKKDPATPWQTHFNKSTSSFPSAFSYLLR